MTEPRRSARGNSHGHNPRQRQPAAYAHELTRRCATPDLVLWVDADRVTRVREALAQKAFDFEYPVIAFRGSYLELMLALEPYGNGLYPEKVLVHLEGMNKDSVKETPVFELYKAGTVFEKNLVTLLREAAVGVATPEEVDAFARTPALTLESVDAWLASLRAQPRDKLTLAGRRGA